MRANSDRQYFRNIDLLLDVSKSVDRNVWDESKYEAYLDELCGSREYQKEAILTAVRYLVGRQYSNLQGLAKANYDKNPTLEKRYGSWEGMKRHLQLPDKLYASLDLATGTGKSYVMYGVAVILLAEGVVDRVLVLCPSTTIESGLISKFRELAGNSDLKDLLPDSAIIRTPRIINASDYIIEGSICVENYHAILKHVKSSIHDSLKGKGQHVLVLNDEAHHIANETASKVKKWKEFLLDEEFDFKYLIGVSGTCYIGDEYFSDVIYRYSLRDAMEQHYVKRIEYIAEIPQTNDAEEIKMQLFYNRHLDNKNKLKKKNILPLTIIVTPTISKCKDVAEELKSFLIETEKITTDSVDEKVLVVYNDAPDVTKLPYVDNPNSNVEWIVSVSMLNEGWDVKRVFQIVPHEAKAFNSKLLIAQVLGRGLRIPNSWEGIDPVVTVFNHDAWAPSIRHLVNEILEIERSLTSSVIEESTTHFDLHNIKYELQTTHSIKGSKAGDYTLFTRDYIDIPAVPAAEDVKIEFERADSGSKTQWKTQIQHKTYTPREVAITMYERLEQAQEDEGNSSSYTEKYTIDVLEQIVTNSLKKCKLDLATESVKQTFLKSLGNLWRKDYEFIRYTPVQNEFFTISTKERRNDSVSAAELKYNKTIFFTDVTKSTLNDEQIEFFDEVVEPGSGYKCINISNKFDFKTPLNLAVADSDNEKKFIQNLLQPENMSCYTAWIKSTPMKFYEIDFAWKKGEVTKRGKFSPDFFIRTNNSILVVEIKGDEELREPSEENRRKFEYADNHFKRVNSNLKDQGCLYEYKFNFLTPKSYGAYFQFLREGNISVFWSELDILLKSNL
jgi:type III restriction enzyme